MTEDANENKLELKLIAGGPIHYAGSHGYDFTILEKVLKTQLPKGENVRIDINQSRGRDYYFEVYSTELALDSSKTFD